MARKFLILLLLLSSTFADASEYPVPAQGDFIIKNFRFASGETLTTMKLHYRTLGTPVKDANGVVQNAVWIGHGTGGSGAQFIRPEFAGKLFRPGGTLDANRYFIILPDGIGHGESSKPSDGLHGHFPHYGYQDMVEAQYRLVTEGLGINHLRLVMGTSMGGMQTWLWGELHPDFMDALMPLACLPTQISGRNRVWRRVIIDAIRDDPQWQDGEYSTQPQGLHVAEEMFYFMGSNPILRQAQMPNLARSDAVINAAVDDAVKRDDANDLLYQIEASRDYDPTPNLKKIQVPLFAVNSADDLINPPELGILEHEMKHVTHGRAIVVPLGPQTQGHATHTIAVAWEQYLVELLSASAH